MGHMLTKKCPKCEIEKEASLFHKNSKQKDGLQTSCKECHSAMKRKSTTTTPTTTTPTTTNAFEQRLERVEQENKELKDKVAKLEANDKKMSQNIKEMEDWAKVSIERMVALYQSKNKGKMAFKQEAVEYSDDVIMVGMYDD